MTGQKREGIRYCRALSVREKSFEMQTSGDSVRNLFTCCYSHLQSFSRLPTVQECLLVQQGYHMKMSLYI